MLSHLDYCDSLLAGLPDNAVSHLQRVQNCAAPVVKQADRCSHITPVPKDLPLAASEISHSMNDVPCRAISSTNVYLWTVTSILSHVHSTIKSSQCVNAVQDFRLKALSLFSVSSPKLWSVLPWDLRQIDSVNVF